MAIESTPDYFEHRDQAMSEIEAAGLKAVEADLTQDQLDLTPHTDDYGVSIYILDGVMELHDPDTGIIHRLERGSKTLVPAQTLHAESCPGPFKALFGLPADMKLAN